MGKAGRDLKNKISNIALDLIHTASKDKDDKDMQYYTLSEIRGYELMLSAYYSKEISTFGRILNVHFEFICDGELERGFWLSFHTRGWLETTIFDEYINYRRRNYY
jgi:hypothetical protein